MLSKSNNANLRAEYVAIKGKRGMLSVSDDYWITRIVAQLPHAQLILNETHHTSAAEARTQYDHLRRALGIA